MKFLNNKWVWLVTGVIISALLHLPFQSWAHPFFSEARFYQFISWLGELIRDFTPWPLLLVSLFVFRPPRRLLKVIIDSSGDAMRNLSSRIRDADDVEIAFLKLKSSNPTKANQLLSEQIQRREKDLALRIDEAANRHQLQLKLESLYQGVVKPEINANKLVEEAVTPRMTVHMSDPLYKDSLFQVVNYVPSDAFPETRKGRRFSTRHGIIGLSWRTKRPEYDPEVSDNPDDLIKKWGMTETEAQKAGLGRKSHLALPFPLSSKKRVKFIFFFDAQPVHIFGDDDLHRKEEIIQKIYNGIASEGLDAVLEQLFSEFEQEKPIIDFTHGP